MFILKNDISNYNILTKDGVRVAFFRQPVCDNTMVHFVATGWTVSELTEIIALVKSVPKDTICPVCAGLGDDNVKYEFNPCQNCNGTGKVIP